MPVFILHKSNWEPWNTTAMFYTEILAALEITMNNIVAEDRGPNNNPTPAPRLAIFIVVLASCASVPHV